MKNEGMGRIAVVGAGAWGTALASLYARTGGETVLLARDPASAEAINARAENTRYLPGIPLPAALRAQSDPARALDGANTVLLVVPTQALRETARALAPHIMPGALAVLCAKGIETASGRFVSQIVAEECPHLALALLSGPSFAADVARGLPTAVTVAAAQIADADAAAQRLSTDSFRPYASDDLRGVEVGGALKNVLALAAGAVAGRGLGASAQAAIVTRGFIELRRLGAALGARPETLMGLSGLGDLVLTCSSPQSRNFAYGMALGSGADRTGLKLAEGVHTAGIAADLARQRGVESPIVETVAALLAGRIDITEAIRALLARPLRREFD